MTDGIIQKVFKRNIENIREQHTVSASPVWRGKLNFAISELEQLEQELIEEIRKEIEDMIMNYGKWNVIIDMKRILIGDNQE